MWIKKIVEKMNFRNNILLLTSKSNNNKIHTLNKVKPSGLPTCTCQNSFKVECKITSKSYPLEMIS